ncbi:MAG: hypothetical protein JXA11_13535 [Phycisphaerae bacterium]|nr:hypothetical protein [Phycisphaerae bacterium]
MSQMNLLPEYYVKRRFRNRVDMLCVILFSLVMGGVIVVGTLQGRKYRDTQQEYELVSEQFQREAGSMDVFMRLRKEKRDQLTAAAQVSQLEERVPRSYLVATVARALPENACLSVLDISEKMSITAAMTQAKKGAKPKGKGRGKGPMNVTCSTDPREEAPKPKLVVQIGGYAATDADVAQIYTTLKSHSITNDVQLRHTREYETETGVYREFQIDWTLQEDADVLDHLTKDVGVVQADPEIPRGERKDG